jgi:threonine/homoserine/homoserine lactone efflux protein
VGPVEARGWRVFARGLLVSLSNPKTLFFYAAFLPQFLGPGTDRADLWLLAATFAVIGALGDGLYAIFAARARAAVTERARRIADRASGAILLGGAAVLLAARR